MPDKQINANEPLTDQEMENVSGGGTVIVYHVPNTKITCRCGYTDYVQYKPSQVYTCPVCGERISCRKGGA